MIFQDVVLYDFFENQTSGNEPKNTKNFKRLKIPIGTLV